MPLVGRSVLRRPSRALQTLTPAPHLQSTPRPLVSQLALHCTHPALTCIHLHLCYFTVAWSVHCIRFLSSLSCLSRSLSLCHGYHHKTITPIRQTFYIDRNTASFAYCKSALCWWYCNITLQGEHSHFELCTLSHLLLQLVCECVCCVYSAFPFIAETSSLSVCTLRSPPRSVESSMSPKSQRMGRKSGRSA